MDSTFQKAHDAQNIPLAETRPPDEGFRIMPLPFCNVIHTLLGPTILIDSKDLSNGLVAAAYTFNIPANCRHIFNQKQCYEIQMRLFKYDFEDEQLDLFPQRFTATLNGKELKLPAFKLIAGGGNNRHTELDERCPEPVNITPSCLPCTDLDYRLSLHWEPSDYEDYVLGIWLVQCTDVDSEFVQISEQCIKVYEESKLLIRNLLTCKDGDLFFDSLAVDFMCPLSFGRIQTPARLKQCVHFQCFDLRNFLEAHKRINFLKCPICKSLAHKEDVIIDNYFAEQLNANKSINCMEVSLEIKWGAAKKPPFEQTKSPIKIFKKEHDDSVSNRSSVERPNVQSTIEINDSDDDQTSMADSMQNYIADLETDDLMAIISEEARLPSSIQQRSSNKYNLRKKISPEKPHSSNNIIDQQHSSQSSLNKKDQQPVQTERIFTQLSIPSQIPLRRQHKSPLPVQKSIPLNQQPRGVQSPGNRIFTQLPIPDEFTSPTFSRTKTSSARPNQLQIRRAVVPERTPTPSKLPTTPTSNRPSRKRNINNSSVRSEMPSKNAKLTVSSKPTNSLTTTIKQSPFSGQINDPIIIEDESPIPSTSTAPTSLKKNSIKVTIKEEFDFDYKEFKNPNPLKGNLERVAKGLPEYHNWKPIEKHLEMFLKDDKNKIVDGPELTKLLRFANYKLYSKLDAISMDSLKLRLRRMSSGCNVLASNGLRNMIDFWIRKRTEPIDGILKKLQDEYKKLNPSSKRRITKENIIERKEVCNREKDLGSLWTRADIREIFDRYHIGLMLLDTSGCRLNMPLFIEADELLFDMRNSIDKVVGFEISDMAFYSAKESASFLASHRAFPSRMNKEVFIRKLCSEVDKQ